MKKEVFIIAEAGVNHNGKLDLAIELCDAAKQAGADAVKFQTFKTEKVIRRNVEMAAYQKIALGESKPQYEMVKELELTYQDFAAINRHCKAVGIEFLSTADEEESLAFLQSLGFNKIKVGSGEINNIPFLRRIGSLQKRVILSTGMATLAEVENALEILIGAGTERANVTLLHCNTEYPTPFEDVNLRAMVTLRKAFKVDVGYSDHTLGIQVPIAAVALGATIVEKHFTLSRTMKGPDHKASLEPSELSEMVRLIRTIELALGDGIKRASISEKKNILLVRRSIVAKTHIREGEIFTDVNLTSKRAGAGLSVSYWDFVIGRQAPRDFEEDDLIIL